jgi:hypothetical protein
MALDRISATMTYVILCEEHLWNVSVLQIARLSNLVILMWSEFENNESWSD